MVKTTNQMVIFWWNHEMFGLAYPVVILKGFCFLKGSPPSHEGRKKSLLNKHNNINNH